MAYDKRIWADGEEGETPIDADSLNHIENGIENVDERLTVIETEGTASAISELKDVVLSELTDGQMLEYDSSQKKWKNTDGGGLVPANESVEVQIANVVESPFEFAIVDGEYGYMKKVEGADTFFPFKSGGLNLVAYYECDVKLDGDWQTYHPSSFPFIDDDGTVTYDSNDRAFIINKECDLLIWALVGQVGGESNRYGTYDLYVNDDIVGTANSYAMTEHPKVSYSAHFSVGDKIRVWNTPASWSTFASMMFFKL